MSMPGRGLLERHDEAPDGVFVEARGLIGVAADRPAEDADRDEGDRTARREHRGDRRHDAEIERMAKVARAIPCARKDEHHRKHAQDRDRDLVHPITPADGRLAVRIV